MQHQKQQYCKLGLYSKRLEAGLFYHTKNQVQSLSPLRGEVWRGVSYLVKLSTVCSITTLFIITGTIINQSAYAQLIPDNTLGTENSIVNQIDSLKNRIEGGATRGSNLFHSFQHFNVDAGKSVYFANPTGIENILTRVTGSNVSNILGTLGVNGTANLFLINPNGIFFGKDAALDIRGSFTATTADSIKLGENGLFSATNPQGSNLLSVQPGALFTNALINQQATIKNEGNLTIGKDLTFNAFSNITTANISASKITLNSINGGINTTNGELDTSSFTGSGGDILLDAATDIRVGKITSKSVNSSGGNIKLISNNSISIEGFVVSGTNICSQANLCNGNSSIGGDIYLKSPLINANKHGILVNIDGLGQGGNLITETDVLNIYGDDNAYFGTLTYGRGYGGNLIVNAKEINLSNGGVLKSNTNGLGNAGNIHLTTNKLLIQDNRDNPLFQTGITSASQPEISNIIESRFINFQLTNDDFKLGKAGDITINASDSIEIIGNQPGPSYFQGLDTLKSILNISAGITTGTAGNGQAGTLIINTKELTTHDGVGITTSSLAPKFIPDFLSTFITTKINNQFNQLDTSTKFLLNSQGITLTSITSNIYDQFSKFSDAGNSGNLEVNADQIKLIGAGGLITFTLSSGNAGNLITKAQQISLQDGSIIAVNTLGTGNAGSLNITTDILGINNGSSVVAGTIDKGFGGNINIAASKSVEVIGTSYDNKSSSSISALSANNSLGNAGNITLDTPNLTIKDGARIEAQTKGAGTAGNIFINNANLINISGVNTFGINSGLFSSSENPNSGNGGTIIINQANPQGILHLSDGGFLSVITRSSSNGGEIGINVNNLNIESGGQIISNAAKGSNAKAGNIDILANDSINITSQNTPQSQNNPLNTNQGINSGLFALSEGTGDAGNISITTQNLNINDGVKISASTTGSGKGGNINITANTLTASNGGQFLTTTSDTAKAGNMTVKVRGNITLDGINTGLFANTEKGSIGNSGNINIDPEIFIIRNGAGIGVNSLGSGQGGNISIEAGTLILDNNAFINAATASSQGGEITLQIKDLLFMRRNSNITATAGTDKARGNGGNININAPFIVAVSNENNDITANAYQGNGGNININTNQIFGLQYRPQETLLSDITASSEFGVSGNVEITTPGVDPTSGLTNLPTSLVDAESLKKDVCAIKDGKVAGGSSFIIAGKGGLPADTHELISNSPAFVEWENNLETVTQINLSPVKVTQKTINHHPQIQQAQGWIITPDGKVILTADTQKVTLQTDKNNLPDCK